MRQEEITRVTKILEGIGLKFAQSIAIQLVDKGIGSKDRFEINRTSYDGTTLPIIKPINYKEEL